MTEINTTSWPPGRYGRRRAPGRRSPRQRAWLLTAATLGVIGAGTVVAYLLGDQYGPGRPYDVTVERFYDITEAQVVVQFTVMVPEGERAVCAVRARGAHGAEVGREEVAVDPPDGQRRAQVVHRLSTTEQPTTGEVQRCWRAD